MTIDDGGAVLLEAHRDVYRRDTRNPSHAVYAAASALGVLDRVDWSTIHAVLLERAGRPRNVTARSTAPR
jgi:hypothetical protein